jgi:hypothetical protein
MTSKTTTVNKNNNNKNNNKNNYLLFSRLHDVLRLEGRPLPDRYDLGNWHQRLLPGGDQGHPHHRQGQVPRSGTG